MRRGSPEILFCTLVWGTVGLIVKELSLPATVIVSFRLLFGATVVLGWIAVRGRLGTLRPRSHRPLLVASGLILAVHWVAEFEAFKRLDIAAAILIIFIGPVLAAALAPAVLGERLHPITLGALAVAFGGIALITVPDIGDIDGAGVAWGLASAGLFAALILAGKALTAHYESSAITAWQLAIAAVVAAPFLARAEAGPVLDALPGMALLGAFHTGVLGILFFRAVRQLKAQHLSVLFYLEPVAAILYAWLLLDEVPAPTTIAGGALVVAAGLAIIVGDRATAAPVGLPEPVPEEAAR